MRVLIVALIVIALAASPAVAQTERGFVSGTAGFATSPDGTTGNLLGEAGVRVAPHLLLFGGIGKFQNLQPSQVQPAVDQAVSSISTADAVVLNGEARVPAWYSSAGLRVEVSTHSRITPYILGSAGLARLTPAAQFTMGTGVLPESTAAIGDDVTSQVMSLGYYTQPNPENALLTTLGGGVSIPLTRHSLFDAGYRFSHVAADSPLNTQGATFGIGYRF